MSTSRENNMIRHLAQAPSTLRKLKFAEVFHRGPCTKELFWIENTDTIGYFCRRCFSAPKGVHLVAIPDGALWTGPHSEQGTGRYKNVDGYIVTHYIQVLDLYRANIKMALKNGT
jgi:hypothetical protein